MNKCPKCASAEVYFNSVFHHFDCARCGHQSAGLVGEDFHEKTWPEGADEPIIEREMSPEETERMMAKHIANLEREWGPVSGQRWIE